MKRQIAMVMTMLAIASCKSTRFEGTIEGSPFKSNRTVFGYNDQAELEIISTTNGPTVRVRTASEASQTIRAVAEGVASGLNPIK
jgi:hypothetical protein